MLTMPGCLRVRGAGVREQLMVLLLCAVSLSDIRPMKDLSGVDTQGLKNTCEVCVGGLREVSVG